MPVNIILNGFMTFLILLYFETEISAIPKSFQFVQLFDFIRYVKNDYIAVLIKHSAIGWWS